MFCKFKTTFSGQYNTTVFIIHLFFKGPKILISSFCIYYLATNDHTQILQFLLQNKYKILYPTESFGYEVLCNAFCTCSLCILA